MDSTNKYTINESKIPSKNIDEDFIYDTPRDFQADFVDWYQNSEEPVCAVTAPTGSGKTATFKYLIQESTGTVLLIYPMNVLIKDQKQINDINL